MAQKWDKLSTSCIICGAPYGKYGEFRLVAQQPRGFTIGEPGKPRIAGKEIPSAEAELEDGTALYAWGELSEPEILKKLVEAVLNREHPWFCMKCGQRVCSECGAPLGQPPGSDIIGDDFQRCHVPIFPIPYKCTNPSCPHSK